MERADMFENMNVLIIKAEASGLGQDEVDSLMKILKSHKVENIDVKSDKDKRSTDHQLQYTHVISNSTNFADYGSFEELMIPVVTSSWVHNCSKLGKLIPLRPYNPDSKYFFKDLVITVSNLPIGDKELIYGGVRALGGQFSDQLLLTTTHLISLDIGDDLCLVARECNETGESDIKIVSPVWIDDCFKLRKKLAEEPYLLDHCGGSGSNDVVKVGELKEIELGHLEVRKSHTDIIQDEDEEEDINLQKIKSIKFLEKTKFYIGQDLKLSDRVKETVSSMITNAGGLIVTTSKITDATLYIGKYRDGEEYLQASRHGVIVGNLNWIYYMMLHQEWIIPTKKLLHYPFVRGGLPGFDKFIIGVTNYTGDGRFYLESLIHALGGTFTKNLKTLNTHLICAKPVGKKYEAAKLWQLNNGIKIINHLWLEESYRKWKILDEEFPRFEHFPKDLNFGQVLGSTELDEVVLRQFWRDGNVDIFDGSESICDSLKEEEEVEEVDERVEIDGEDLIVEKNQSIESDEKNRSKNGNSNNNNNNKRTRVEEEEKEEDVSVVETKKAKKKPMMESIILEKENSIDKQLSIIEDEKTTTTNVQVLTEEKSLLFTNNDNKTIIPKRSAKLKAEIKLHSDMEDLNSFQKLQHCENKLSQMGVVVDHLLITNDDDKGQKKKNKNKKKKSIGQKIENTREKYQLDCIVTGCENEIELNEGNLEILRQIGINVIQDLDFFNRNNDDDDDQKRKMMLVAPRILRTEKFLTLLSLDLDDILIPQFLVDVINNFKTKNDDEMVDIDEYQLKKFLNYENDLKLKEIWNSPSPSKIDNLLHHNKKKEGLSSSSSSRNILPVFSNIKQMIILSTSQDMLKNSAYARILQRHGCQNCEIVHKLSELDEKLLLPLPDEESLDNNNNNNNNDCDKMMKKSNNKKELKKDEKVRKILSKKKLGKKYLKLNVDYDWVVKKIMLEI